jgi:ssDNA-specific exonuclease RecJ
MTIKDLIQAELEQIPEEKLEQVYHLIRNFNQKNDESSSDWDDLENLLEECQVETGISDFSYQHDYYLHGTPKREEV